MRKFLAFVLTAVFATSVFAASAVKIQNYEREISGASDAAVGKAIANAVTRSRWTIQKQTANEIIATLYVRQHAATVSIIFNQDGYAIDYQSSENLDYNEKRGTIHPNYNRWVGNLDRNINRAIAASAQAQ